MPAIMPVSTLRSYTEVLDDVAPGSPVFLTKNGRGRYAILDMDEDSKINSVSRRLKDGVANYSINIVLLRKSLLERLVNEATSLGYRSFTDDI